MAPETRDDLPPPSWSDGRWSLPWRVRQSCSPERGCYDCRFDPCWIFRCAGARDWALCGFGSAGWPRVVDACGCDYGTRYCRKTDHPFLDRHDLSRSGGTRCGRTGVVAWDHGSLGGGTEVPLLDHSRDRLHGDSARPDQHERWFPRTGSAKARSLLAGYWVRFEARADTVLFLASGSGRVRRTDDDGPDRIGRGHRKLWRTRCFARGIAVDLR